jgi:hypothetical protein
MTDKEKLLLAEASAIIDAWDCRCNFPGFRCEWHYRYSEIRDKEFEKAHSKEIDLAKTNCKHYDPMRYDPKSKNL